MSEESDVFFISPCLLVSFIVPNVNYDSLVTDSNGSRPLYVLLGYREELELL